jgi:hypothetical protein
VSMQQWPKTTIVIKIFKFVISMVVEMHVIDFRAMTIESDIVVAYFTILSVSGLSNVAW